MAVRIVNARPAQDSLGSRGRSHVGLIKGEASQFIRVAILAAEGQWEVKCGGLVIERGGFFAPEKCYVMGLFRPAKS